MSVNQASLELQIYFPPLDKGHQEISCRAAVHKESAETIRLFSAPLGVVKSSSPKLSLCSFPIEKNHLLVPPQIGSDLVQIK